METMTAPGARVVLAALALALALALVLVLVVPALVAPAALAVRTIQTTQPVCPAANPRPTAAPSVARCSSHQTRKNRSQMTAQETAPMAAPARAAQMEAANAFEAYGAAQP